ncbi:DgyrCDS10304 [Dimorphilus gyrociliatus]|uniref:DgyrCDS10304 n=1 Tax=Dimorphilus gyrociliatus TaxID=2664684 RepID=A0A7I8W002_9ANNE|nr:DgyrCDS10304 [Dimorphilus gyrociliatus]
MLSNQNDEVIEKEIWAKKSVSETCNITKKSEVRSVPDCTIDGENLTLIEALRKKYEEPSNVSGLLIFVPERAPRKTVSGRLILTSNLIMDHQNIIKIGDFSSIKDELKKVADIDFNGNYLSSWEDIFHLITHCPKLHSLNLKRNAGLKVAKLDICIHKYCFDNVQTLVLNALAINWKSLLDILKIFPGIKELYLSENNYNSVSLPIDFKYETLNKLFFNNNGLSSWKEVCKLGRAFPNMESLILIENNLDCLSLNEEDIQELSHYFKSEANFENSYKSLISSYFPSLKMLNLNKNPINGFAELENISHFPKVEDFRGIDIDFLNKYKIKLRRQLTISYLPNIRLLNNSVVGYEERIDAERAFIRHYMDKECKPSRYSELEKKHGKLDKLVNISLKPEETVKFKHIIF